MAKIRKGKPDETLRKIAKALAGFERAHPHAQVELYRQNLASVRIRIIDESFAKQSLIEREQSVWPHLESLPQDVLDDVTVLLLLAPSEQSGSLANLNFEDPLPSQL